MTPALLSAALIAVLMLTLWVVSAVRRDVSVVDLGWGLGFALIAAAMLVLRWQVSGPESIRAAPSAWLLPLLTGIWGGRLSGYLAWRNHGQPEDRRYAAMRARRGASFWWQSLWLVFGLQGVVMWCVAWPLWAGIPRAAEGWSVLHLAGGALWLVGVTFETVGDWQLARFRRDPANRGQVLDRGLWRYTRHPNYFGDCCVWWGLYLVAAAHAAAWWTIPAPVLMTVLLLKVSGVTLLESTLRAEKPGYADYVRRTSAFWPRPPRR